MTLRVVGESDTEGLLRLIESSARKIRERGGKPADYSDLNLLTRRIVNAAYRLHCLTVGAEVAELHVGAAMSTARDAMTDTPPEVA